jgi:hypothetical protein
MKIKPKLGLFKDKIRVTIHGLQNRLLLSLWCKIGADKKGYFGKVNAIFYENHVVTLNSCVARGGAMVHLHHPSYH